MKKPKFPKHAVDAANALLNLVGQNVADISKEKLEQLPEVIATAVKGLLQPYGWHASEPQQEFGETKYLSVAGAERYASMSRWTLGRAADRGELQKIKIGGAKSSKILFDRTEIDRWLKSRRCR